MVEYPLGLITRVERLIGNKLGVSLDFIKRQWRRLLLAMPTWWPLRGMEHEHLPMTDAQLERFSDAILASIDKDAACKLASDHSSNLPCQVDSVQRGSYNISDARVMTDPSATQPYLLCDDIPGQSLTFKQVSDATSGQRVEIFSDLINIYAQFFNLRFPVAGSLLPGTQKHASPHFGGLLSMSRNELQLVAVIEPPKPQIIYSAESYLQHRLEPVSESARLPLVDATLEEVREQVCALHHLKLRAYEIMRSMQSDDSDTFILTHPDLHYANIIVDEGLKIQGIIDWECASTIPLYLFTPPPAWVTGHEGRGLLFPPREINDDFRKALELSEHQELKNYWRLHEESSVHLATAQILCRPNKLERLFYEYIFSAMFTGSHDEVVSLFFADDKNPALAEEVDQQLKASERYTVYTPILKKNGQEQPKSRPG